jgi:hypothetical protein
VLVPIAIVALYLLAFAWNRLFKVEALGLAASVAFSMACHSTILVLVLAVLVLFCALKIIGQKTGTRTPVLTAPCLAALSGLIVLLASNFIITHQLALAPGGSNFLFGRLVQDRIVARYLSDQCPDPKIRLCAFQARLPDGADGWLWGDSPLYQLGGWEEFEPEARRIIWSTIVRYPLMHMRTAAKAALEQLLTLTTGEGLGSKDNWHAESVLQRYAPETLQGFRASLQQNDRFDFRLLNFIHVPVALLATVLLPIIFVALRARSPEVSPLALTAFFAIVVNAAICGIFSNPNPRYQSRIVPLAVLPIVMVTIERFSQRRTAAGPANAAHVNPR